jgi:hypothetical protein
MLPSTDTVTPSPPRYATVLRLVASLLLLAAAALSTWQTIDGLAQRRVLRTQLAEISHVRYGLLNADRWVEKLVPILDAQIEALDIKAANRASLRPMVRNALNRLLDQIKEKMSAPPPPKPAGSAPSAAGLLGQGNAFIVNAIVGALRPHIPEYTDMVLAELGRPEAKQALKNYIRSVLAEGAKTTFGNIDMTLYSSILKEHGCAEAAGCKQVIETRIREADTKITHDYLGVLVPSAVAFLILLTAGPILSRSSTVMLLLFCVVLLLGGVLSPMLEVEAKISRLSMTFLGTPISFTDQVLYFQSKSVLEVFHTLIATGRPDMWIVGVLVLTFSVVFPTLKIIASSFYLYKPDLLRRNAVARFFALESSKWSMADVMALAIFMAFVAFNGLISNTMRGLQETGAEVAIPTDSSKILPGYYLFIGFCLASLFLSRKLSSGIRASRPTEPN